MRQKPKVYIASAYTRGDVAANVHFQCQMFDRLLGDGKVTPYAPLWNHFQHMMFPRAYEDWLEYDNAMLPVFDACLRMVARVHRGGFVYEEAQSSGADDEVHKFREMNKPVFYSVGELYNWVGTEWNNPEQS